MALPDRRSWAYYFGTFRRPGHYLWTPGMGRGPFPSFHAGLKYEDYTHYGIPWGGIDGELMPHREQGVCAMFHKDGWTAIGFRNNTDDNRGGNSAFLFERPNLTFEEALALARATFPEVVERLPFDLREAEHVA